jgi:hypothetical protein
MDLPEQRRGSDARAKPPKQLWVDDTDGKERKGPESEVKDDGFTMSSLRGAERR